jgi:hypothetical protein
MADQMNNTPKYVVSRTLTSADWHNSTLINGRRVPLTLAGQEAFSTGVLHLTYTPAS